MNPVRFAEVNTVRTAPPGMDNCRDVHCYADTTYCITAWRPTREELVRLNLGEPVYLGVLMGGKMPPVFLTVDSPFQQLQQKEEPEA